QAAAPPAADKNKIHPIKKLNKKFRKNRLNAVDSAFNAHFFYYIWRLEKSPNPAKYKACIIFMTILAKLYGTVIDFFAPMLSFIYKTFKPVPKRRKAGPLRRAAALAAPAGVLAFTMLSIINIMAYKPELELWINGEQVGLVASRDIVSSASSRSELNISAILGGTYEFSGSINYKIALVKEPEYITEREIYSVLYGYSQNYIMSAYGLYIDGALVGITIDDSYINEALDYVLEEISDLDSDETVEFANDIQIIRKDYAKKDVLSGEDFINIVTYSAVSAAEESVAEEVVPLSVFSDLQEDEENYQTLEAIEDIAAAAAAVSLSDEAISTLPRGGINSLAEANDNSLLARLSRSSANASGIQFMRKRIESYFIEMPFETRRVNSDQHFAGTEVVQTAGANGTNKITAEISSIGDEEISREILDNEIITLPTARVIIVGTKPRPTTNPTGSFLRPLRGGNETTQFSAGHRALDISAPHGTIVSAADGGTVIYAGFSGSYGNHIKIRHANGYVTLYAHMSSLSVHQGASVFKGQEIGRVGSTGRSTGPHLHFEVIKNGVQVNPKNYIN
ncbi:MAG: peptidoglycan DD-metalloendopeptidase family protein, partial [Oscillospiraceae bacterium]|nr:peptidoglycan DD-metalloendopeptidase family protein [Oscillospiraceae bacterium]